MPSLEIAKIFNTTMSKEAPGWVGLKFKSRQQLVWISTEEYIAITAQIKALINQQIKSVLDELEGEIDDGRNSHSMKVISSTIQKIKSRYE